MPVGDLASPSLRASSCASCTSPWTSCSALLLSWEAPRWWMQLLLWIIWPGIMMGFFFLACVAPSSSSVSSDCVVLAVCLPTLAQLERRAGQGHWCWLCVSVCLSVLTRCGVAVRRCVCVCAQALFTRVSALGPNLLTQTAAGPAGMEGQQNSTPGLLNLANPNSHTPRSVCSSDLLKMDSATIQATGGNVGPQGSRYKSLLHSFSSRWSY